MPDSKKKDTDEYRGVRGEEVQREVEEWDMVICALPDCNRKISLMNCKFTSTGQAICKSH